MTWRLISAVGLIGMVFCGCPPNTEEVVVSKKCNIHEDCEEGLFCVFGECKSQNITVPILSDAGSSSSFVDIDSGETQNAVVDSGAILAAQDSGTPVFILDAGELSEMGSFDAGFHTNATAMDASINNVDPISLGGSSDGGVVDSGNGYAGFIFEYVENADFELYEFDTVLGLNMPTGWSFESTSGETYELTETTDESRLHVMEIDRALVGDHWAMMTQTRDAYVEACDRLVLSGNVRPMGQGSESPGATQGQFPVHLRVLYNDSLGDLYTFQVGIYFKGSAMSSYVVPQENCEVELGTCLNFETYKVAQNEWFTVPAIDLMDLTPKPEIIRSFHLGSSGTSFKAQFDNVQIYGTGSSSCGVNNTNLANQVDAGPLGGP